MVSLIIPTLNAGAGLGALLHALSRQTVPPEEIIVVDSSSADHTLQVAEEAGARTLRIPRESFDHGGTRNLAASGARGDFLIFMTQDALPADEYLVANLMQPLADDSVAASYARQIPREDATPVEAFARHFNYPAESSVKGLAEVARMGIRAFFMSNVCSCVRAGAFRESGGFPENIIMNEDTVLAAKLMRKGYRIAYAADARVIHSHDYSLVGQLKRYFDIGVSHKDFEGFLRDARAMPEGLRLVRETVRFLAGRKQPLWIAYAFLESAFKFAGFRLGLHYRRLPPSLLPALSMHRRHFEKRA